MSGVRILFLLFLASSIFVQVNKGLWRKYVPIPSAPSQSSPHTLVPGDAVSGCCGAGIFDSLLLSGNHQVKTSGNFSAGLSLRNWIGTASSPYVIVNTAGDIYGNAAGGAEGVSRTGNGNYWYLYGLSATAPMIVKGNNAIQLPAHTAGGNFIVQNAVGRYPLAAGITANFDTSSGSYYGGLNISFWRKFGTGVDATDQEGICYLGATHTGFATIANVVLTNNFSFTSAREGIQIEHITLATVTHNTCILAGQGGVGGQTNSLQAHDLGPGSVIRYNIFDNSPIAFNIFTHGTKIQDNLFVFSSAASFIGRTDNAYFSTSPNLTGDSLIFDGDYFLYNGGGSIAKL